MILEGLKISKYFGGLKALSDVSFHINEKEIVGLIGPNGAGKTTLFNIITGVMMPTTGRILFKNEDITGLKPHDICRKGIARTFQIPRSLLDMTVVENVMISLIHGRKHLGLSDARKEAVKFLELVGLNNERDRTVNNLSLAGRRLLEVARALALNPEVILLDEVIAGLNPSETVKVMDLIKSIRKDMGITIFWVEHVMRAIMNTAERIIVLDKGMVIAEGPPIEITNSTRVIEAYLGKKLGAENA